MAKYTDKQKLEAVKAYRKGTGGLRATAEAQGVHVDSLRKWVAGYGALGAAGVVTKKRSNYSLEFKLEVLRRARDEGISCRQAAALFDIRAYRSGVRLENAATLAFQVGLNLRLGGLPHIDDGLATQHGRG